MQTMRTFHQTLTLLEPRLLIEALVASSSDAPCSSDREKDFDSSSNVASLALSDLNFASLFLRLIW